MSASASPVARPGTWNQPRSSVISTPSSSTTTWSVATRAIVCRDEPRRRHCATPSTSTHYPPSPPRTTTAKRRNQPPLRSSAPEGSLSGNYRTCTFRMQVVPAIVYKVDDPGNTRTSSFTFDLAVICSTDCELTPVSASVELSGGGLTVERQQWTTEMLAKTKKVSYRVLPDTPAWSSIRLF